jgi:hypothetical protein
MTAEDLLHESYFNIVLDIRETYLTDSDITSAMKEYARLKCEELLKIVVEKAEVEYDWNTSYVDRGYILNAVDLNEFIK